MGSELRSTRTRRSTQVFDARISSSYEEVEKSHYRYPAAKKRTDDPRFFHVKNFTEFHETESSSSEEECYASVGNKLTTRAPQAGWLPNTEDCLEGNHFQAAKVYRSAYDEMSRPRIDERRMHRKETLPQEHRRDTRDQCSHHYQRIYPAHNQDNTRRGCSLPLYQANTQSYSHNQIQDRKEKLNAQHNMQRSQEAERKEWCNRETRLPPIQQHTRVMAADPRQLNRFKEEDRHQPLLFSRRYGRQEVCEERNQRGRRRIGICQQTDSTQEQRTFVRILGKRF